jgi:poly(3-hydroxybutyrate) depolymerase
VGGAGDGGQDASSSGGSDGGGGDAGPVVASAGCGKSGRPTGGRVLVANDHIYDFPPNYDGNKPMPLVFVLHGANNPNTLVEGQTNGSRLAMNFVRAFPKSTGAAWSYGGGTGADSQRLTTIYNDLLANYCVDTSRVFLSGHSSGAQMSVQMLCAAGGDKRFKAAAPVAASKYCDMLTPVPVMYIQGMMDAMRGNGNGANVVAVFVASNMCTSTTMPYAPVATCNSTFDNKPVNPGCINYQGCSKPTIWCSHNDNVYNLTDGHEHGWPCFAANAMADFFLSLP